MGMGLAWVGTLEWMVAEHLGFEVGGRVALECQRLHDYVFDLESWT